MKQPLLINMHGTDVLYLGVFSDAESLRAIMAHLQITDFTMKQITDGGDFLDSIPRVHPDGRTLHIAVDLRLTEKGTMRFAQVARD